MRTVVGLVVGLVCSTVLAGAPAPRALTFEDRVKAQRAIEQVYWNHRIWPKDNPSRKPPLDVVMSDALIRSKVTDYLKKSNALGTWWQRPISGEQLQAELGRMAKGSRDPQVLRELFAALGNDPYVIAETLARQALADRLIRNWFANDTRFHGDSRAKAAAALLSCSSAGCMKSMGGDYRETTLQLRGQNDNPQRDAGHELKLDSTEWDAALNRLAGEFGVTPDSIPLGKLSPVDETGDAFAVRAVLGRKPTELVTAVVVWPKQPFDAWWASQDTPSALDPLDKPVVFKLPPLAAAGCQDDTWSPTRQDFPDARAYHTTVWTGTEMIVWGGENRLVYLNSGGRYNPSTDSWATTSMRNVPDARFLHTAVWTGTEMIVWGGTTQQSDFNTGGRYDPGADTWKVTSTGDGVPSARASHTAVWTGTQMIVWGGYQDASGGRYNPSNDSWLPTSVGDNAPTSRAQHTAVWTGSQMIVWGGWGYTGGNQGFSNTGGLYDPITDTWMPTSTGAQVPSHRSGHSAVWTGTEMIIWGGYQFSLGVLSSGGRYNPSTDSWTATSAGAYLPARRNDHTAVWTGTEMIVWGGVASNDTTLNSGGRYDPASDTWRATSTGTNVPSGRYSQSSVWTGKEMIVWGGNARHSGYPDWLSSGGRYDPVTDSWVPTASAGQTVPSARAYQSAVWTGVESCVWGGINIEDAAVYFNTGGCYDASTDDWKATAIDANTPTGREGQTAVWTGTEMIVWGGWPGSSAADTGGRYSPISGTWTGTSRGANLPVARGGHTAVWTGTQMIIWGGYGDDYLNTGGLYDPATDGWSPISIPTGEPAGRTGHTAIWTGTEMIVWGGSLTDDGYRDVNTGGRYNPSTDHWMSTPVGMNVPSSRSAHTAVWTGREMIIWGGSQYNNGYYGYFNTGGRYNPITNTWASISTDATTPLARDLHSAVWTGVEMIVWGGYNPDIYATNSGGRYNPATDIWLPTRNDATTPMPRELQSAVWTGSEMMIWGGGPFTSSGGLYCAHTRCSDDTGPVSCDDGNPCTDDSCDPGTGCVHTDNITPCDDGNACTSNDTCSEGRCIGHSGCEDGLPCTDDRADPANGCACSNPVSLPGTICIDGNRCTIGTVCDGAGGGATNCGGGTVFDCNDGNPCTDDACDPAIGCVHTNNTSTCDDGLACTTADTCAGGECHGGPPPDCDDGNVCTDDSCANAIGCINTPNSNTCDDGNVCDGPGYCDYSGTCQQYFPLYCNDHNACTADTCNPETGCVFTNIEDGCDDGNVCTTGDTCHGGTCRGNTLVVCDDDNPCTDDHCDASHGCFFLDNTNVCDDGNACTTGDTCLDGTCLGNAPVVCDDNNACTNDSCNPATGCVFTSNANACDDQDQCTSGDVCGDGTCRGTAVADGTSCNDQSSCTSGDACIGGSCRGTAIVCDDANVCTTDSCNPATGCVHINNTNACDDGNACTTDDRCGPRPGSRMFEENFDVVTGSGFPAGWTTLVSGGGFSWVTRADSPDTPPFSAFGRETDYRADSVLVSPPIAITSPNAILTFRNRWSLEADEYCFDGGVLEIKTGSEAFTDVVTAGGSFISGGYTGTIESYSNNPLATRAAWCNTSPGYPGYVTTQVLLPANTAGQTIQLRWRLGSDSSGSIVGQDIDSIIIGDPMNLCNGGPAADCDDGNPCTDDSCNPASGCVHSNNTNSCSDGNACTSGDICGGGACHGTPIVCDDGNACTTHTCNPATGCVFSNTAGPCDDGNACTTNDICAAHQYFAENFDSVTTPALPAGWNSVVVGTASIWATRAGGNDTLPNSMFGADSDQIADETLESPAISIATATARLTFRNRWKFDDAENCYDAGVLEIKIGAGSYADIVAAGGTFISGGYSGTVSAYYGNPLANRSAWCSTSTGYPDYVTTAVNLPAAAAGQTVRLRWRLGSDASAAAIGQDIDSVVISEALSVCTGGPARDCNDNNPCTDDSCDPATGCVHTNNTNACDDGNACTSSDACGGGSCHGTPIVCDDNNVCTTDMCNSATGCVHTNNTNFCDDGNACTSGDACGGGSCHGIGLSCDDGNPCTDDSCNPATGCVHTNNTNSCSDGNACTIGGVCGGGTCHVGTPIVCNDNNPCTNDTCNPAAGCVYFNNTNSCSDGNACTTGDTCSGGSCHAGTPIVCAPADACHTAGTCNPATGTCSSINAPDGTACTDNNLCTTGDTCRAGICTPTFNGLNHPRPKSAGYYEQLCDDSHGHGHATYHGEHLTDADALCVAGLTATFDYFRTVDDLCNVLDDDNDHGWHGGRHHGCNGNGPNGHDCDKAENELIATALNICRARVCLAQDLDSHCHGNNHTTVAQSFADGDAILDNVSRDQHTCSAARCELREINNGHALEMNSLVLSIEHDKVRLTWEQPVMDDGAGTPSYYELWRRPMGSGDEFTKLGQSTGLTFVDGAAGTALWEYDVSAVMP